MLSWLVIGILVVVGILAIKMNHLRHRVFIILLITVALFFYLSLTYVNHQNEVDLSNIEGILTASELYLGWLANGFHNVKDITGYAISMDWTDTDRAFFQNKSRG